MKNEKKALSIIALGFVTLVSFSGYMINPLYNEIPFGEIFGCCIAIWLIIFIASKVRHINNL